MAIALTTFYDNGIYCCKKFCFILNNLTTYIAMSKRYSDLTVDYGECF